MCQLRAQSIGSLELSLIVHPREIQITVRIRKIW